MKNTTRKLCAFAFGLRPHLVPAQVRQKIKLHILDAIGCGIAGAGTDIARRLSAFVALERAGGEVPVPGSDERFGPAGAAFVTSGCMNALDFDDGVEIDGKGMGHPGATIVAAGISGAWDGKVNGRTFLCAMTAAFEINNRLIASMQPSIDRFREVYGVCQHQSVPAAIAYGLQVGLDEAALENSVGFAGTLANVPSLRKYNFDDRPIVSLKDFNAPAAETGVRAVQLHQAGLFGARAVLDGPHGLWRMLGSDRFSADDLVRDLGSTWAAMNGTFKPYPTCRWMHTVLEAFDRIVRDYGLSPGQIEEIVVRASESMRRDFMDVAPETMVDAQFSLPYALAMIAHGVPPGAGWYTPAAMNCREMQRLRECVRAEIDPDAEQLMSDKRRPAGRVSVRTTRDLFESPLFEFPLGGAVRPVSEAWVEEKFLRNVGPILGEHRAAELCRRIMTLEQEDDMRALIDFMRVSIASG